MGGDVVKTKLAYFHTNDEASMYESALIFFMNDLTNIMPCKSGGHEHSPESIHKIREAAKGRVFPEETRRKSTPQHYPPKANFGSIEHREKLRLAATGLPVSKEGLENFQKNTELILEELR